MALRRLIGVVNMGAILNIRKAMASYRLGEQLSHSLERLLMENIARIHSKTRISGKSVAIATQVRRCTTICASLAELREGGYALTSPHSMKQKHIKYLVDRWVAHGQKAGTVENKLTHLRTLCEWIGKDNLVCTLGDYVDRDALGLKRSYVATVDKSWDGKGVAATDLIEAISREEPLVGVQLKLQAAFGLRVRESHEFKVYRAIKDLDTLRITDGTKGGRPREVPILMRMAVLEEAAQLCNPYTGSLMPVSMTARQWNRYYYLVMERFGITEAGRGVTSHGLRHQYLQEYFKRLTGEDAPIKGGAKPQEDLLRQALQGVVDVAGHSRRSKSGAYLSTHAAMKREYRRRVTPVEAESAIAEAEGNISRAADSLGVSRQALYRALSKIPPRSGLRAQSSTVTNANRGTFSRKNGASG
jgi:hypothetical protein